MAGRWVIGAGGIITPAKNWTHNSAPEPTVHGITPGHAPAGFVHEGKPKSTRRFDKPTADQIKEFMREDDAWSKKQVEVEPVYYESKKDLETGKLRIDKEIFRPDGGISPHGLVENADGTSDIVRKDKIPPKPVTPPPATTKSELVLPPTEGKAPENALTLKTQIKRGFGAIMNSDGTTHLRRTF